MFQFYQNAFHARKTYEGTPPDSDDIHIMMDIYGVENLIGSGVAPVRCRLGSLLQRVSLCFSARGLSFYENRLFKISLIYF